MGSSEQVGEGAASQARAKKQPREARKIEKEVDALNAQEEDGVTSPTDLPRQFVDAYIQYARDLTNAWASQQAWQQAADTYQNYLRSLGDLSSPQKVQERAAKAYQTYLTELLGTAAPAEAHQRAHDAYRNYVRSLQQASWPMEAQQGAVNAYRDYMKDLQAALASDDLNERLNDANRNYMRTLQEAWSTGKLEGLDVPSLALVSQSIWAAAWMTAASKLALRQRSDAAAYLHGIESFYIQQPDSKS